jgi:putative flippase GtrA
MRVFHGQLRRFLLTGMFNTVNGYAWILGLQIITGQPLLANMLGYGVAAVIGYVAHCRYTFKQQSSWRTAAAYSVVIGGSYLVNLAVLKWSLSFVPAVLAQTMAISVSMVFCYLGQSRFTFSGTRNSNLP